MIQKALASLVLVFGLSASAQIQPWPKLATSIEGWTPLQISNRISGCLQEIAALVERAKGGEKIEPKVITAAQNQARSCVLEHQIHEWLFFYSFQKQGSFASKEMAGIDGLIGTVDWIGSVARARELRSHCDALPLYLEQAYCYAALVPWWAEVSASHGIKPDHVRTAVASLESSAYRSGNSAHIQIMNKPAKTAEQRARKRDLLVLLADWWFEDAANLGDMRDSYEKAQTDPEKANPPLIIEGFRRSLLALKAMIRLYPQDVSTISDAVWLQATIEQNELELAEFRGKSAQWSGRIFATIREYEKANRNNFYFYSALLDNFSVGIRNWAMESASVRSEALSTYRSVVSGAARTAPAALKQFESAFEKAQSSDQKTMMLDELIKHFNSLIAAQARVGYFDSASLVGASPDARKARAQKGGLPKVVRLGAAYTAEQKAGSQAEGATHFIAHPKELRAWLSKSAEQLRR